VDTAASRLRPYHPARALQADVAALGVSADRRPAVADLNLPALCFRAQRTCGAAEDDVAAPAAGIHRAIDQSRYDFAAPGSEHSIAPDIAHSDASTFRARLKALPEIAQHNIADCSLHLDRSRHVSGADIASSRGNPELSIQAFNVDIACVRFEIQVEAQG